MGKALDSFINSDSLKTLDKRRKKASFILFRYCI